MKINITKLLNQNTLHPNFKHSENEYISVPLIWDDTCDTFERAQETEKKDPLDNLPENSGFKKFVGKAKKIGGTIAVGVPTVDAVAQTVKNTTQSIANSLKETTQTVLTTKEEIKDMFGKHHKEESVEQPVKTTQLGESHPNNEDHSHNLQEHDGIHHEEEHNHDEEQYQHNEEHSQEMSQTEIDI